MYPHTLAPGWGEALTIVTKPLKLWGFGPAPFALWIATLLCLASGFQWATLGHRVVEANAMHGTHLAGVNPQPLNYQPTITDPLQFELWLARARPGDVHVYAIACRLDADCADSETPRLVRAAYRSGFVTLVQKRLAWGRYEYRAIRRLIECDDVLPRRMVGDELGRASVGCTRPERRPMQPLIPVFMVGDEELAAAA